MHSRLAALVLLALHTGPLLAGTGKIVVETWDAAYLGEGKAGHVHTLTREIQRDGKTALDTTLEVRLTVKRFSDTIQMSMDTGTIERSDGAVIGTFMKQFLGQQQQAHIQGDVVGNEIHLKLNGNTPLKPAPWNSDVLGLYKQQLMYKERKLKPGDRFTYQSFEPTINLVLKSEVVVRGYREVELKGAKDKRKLLLIETIPEAVEYRLGGKADKLQLPASLTWLDEKYEPVKTDVEVPGLGPIVLYRTTRAQALASGPIAQLNDIGLNQLVRLKSSIARPYETRSAVYRITIRNDENAASAFCVDERQQVKNSKGSSFELHVRAGHVPAADAQGGAPAAEFTGSSYFINSDDAKVKELARKAIRDETDAWKKALRIERWVHDNMRVANHEALATADHVARTLRGDCTEYGMLTAALCRAEGVPSRTAIGLIYADVKGSPCFAFHMWTEVWIKGRWIAIDATLGKGHVGATHLKITDHSWHDERTMTPILPVLRVVGRVGIEVLGTDYR